MSIQQNYMIHCELISNKLASIKDQVRNLIGKSHWNTDGMHKEYVLRQAIKEHIPKECQVKTGFICYENGNSNQIDILITKSSSPQIHGDGDITFITADAALAIIEVKTTLIQNNKKITNIINKICDNIENIRNFPNHKCKSGLFVYDKKLNENQIKNILNILHDVCRGTPQRAINFISLGQNIFIRYWEPHNTDPYLSGEPGWCVYDLPKISYSYFINNVICALSENSTNTYYAWFPYPGGKDRKCILYKKF